MKIGKIENKRFQLIEERIKEILKGNESPFIMGETFEYRCCCGQCKKTVKQGDEVYRLLPDTEGSREWITKECIERYWTKVNERIYAPFAPRYAFNGN